MLSPPPTPPPHTCSYIVLNRPYALMQWVAKAAIPEKYVLMSEPDHVWLKPMPNLMRGSHPGGRRRSRLPAWRAVRSGGQPGGVCPGSCAPQLAARPLPARPAAPLEVPPRPAVDPPPPAPALLPAPLPTRPADPPFLPAPCIQLPALQPPSPSSTSSPARRSTCP
jgi:hypothetical protein